MEDFNYIFPETHQLDPGLTVSLPLEQQHYLLNGELVKWTGAIEEVYSAISTWENGELKPYRLGSYPKLGSKESLQVLDSALAAYNKGLGLWPTMTVEERIKHVEKFVRQMTMRKKRIVQLLMFEIGKSLPDAEKEFDRTIEYIRDTIEALKELDRNSSRLSIHQGVLAQIRRSPLGVVLCMGPYNYPLNETLTTLIPALIMGNVVIFKAPRLGVLLHEPLLEAYRSCFPKGVVNTVYGDGKEVVGPLMESGKLDSLAFIGSSHVANILKHQHPKPNRLRSILGLEAKNVAIIMEDADLNLAVQECLSGALSFNGQRCTALKMIYVHESCANGFMERFTSAVDNLHVGLPWNEGVKLTPLPENRSSYFFELIKDANSKGAHVANNKGASVAGNFFYPAVIYPVRPDMRIAREEQFGPVVPVGTYNQIEEVLDYLVQSDYGQQISIFGKDPFRIGKLIDPLVNLVSRVNINSQCQRGPDIFPFTGRKDSAEGTLSVSDALRSFSIRSLVAAKTTEENKEIIRTILDDDASNFLSTDFIL